MGFSICAEGFPSINWDVAIKIFISWIISPVVAGLIAFAFFVPLRWFVLRHDNAYKRAYLTFPIVLFIGVGIDLFYVLYKAGKNFNAKEALPLFLVLPVSFGVGAICGLLWLKPVGPWTMKRINARLDKQGEGSTDQDEENMDITHAIELGHTVDTSDEAEDEGESNEDEKDKSNEDEGAPDQQEDNSSAPPVFDIVQEDEPTLVKKKSMLSKMSSKFVENTYGQDLHSQSMHESAHAASIWEAGEHFDPHAEQLFTYVQSLQLASTHLLMAPTTCRMLSLRSVPSLPSTRLESSLPRLLFRGGYLYMVALVSSLVFFCMDTR